MEINHNQKWNPYELSGKRNLKKCNKFFFNVLLIEHQPAIQVY